MIDRIIRFVYYSLFFITPLLVNPATSELFEFNKMMFIYFSAFVVLALWAADIVKEKKIILRRTIFDLPIGIFLISQVASTVTSIDRHTSFLGYYGRFNGGLLSIVSYIVLFYGFATFMKSEHIRKLLKVSLISSFLVILWGLPGRIGHDLSCLVFTGQFNNSCWTEQFRPSERMFSTLGQPNWLGAYLIINFFIALYFLTESALKKKVVHLYQKLIYPVYLFFNISAVLFSRSRSALLALGVCTGLFFIGTWFKTVSSKRTTFVRQLFAPVAVLSVLAVVLFQTGIPRVDRFLRPFSNTPQKVVTTNIPGDLSSDVTESLDIRKIVWNGAWRLGLKNPLFGTGVETFAYSYYTVRPKEHNLTSEWDYLYNKAHNEFLNYFATTGFFGIGTYLFFIGFFLLWSIQKVIKKKGEEAVLLIALVSGWISILITNFFGFSTTMVNIFFYLIPGILLVRISAKKSKELYLHVRETKFGQRFSYVIVGLASFFILGWLVLYYIADINYASATAYSQAGDYQKATELYNSALQLHYEHVYEDKLSYSLANMAFLAAYQKEPKLAEELIKQSDFHNSRTLNASIKNPLYWKTRGKNYYLFYQIRLNKDDLEEAIHALNEDQKLSPTDPKIPYTIAIFYSLLADEEREINLRDNYESNAIAFAKESTELKPNFRDGYFLQAQLYKKYGDSETALQILQNILKVDPKDLEVKEEILDLSK